MSVVVFNGSPHVHGITDSIVQYLIQQNPQVTSIVARDISMRGCIHCGYCRSNTILTKQYTQGCCTIAKESDIEVFTKLLSMDSIIWVAPIYFYHLPAVAKAVIDRSQALYYMQNKKGKDNKKLFPILHAGRIHGNKLFEGALLTLRYFAKALGFDIGEALLLRGTDEKYINSIEEFTGDILQYCRMISFL